jgi:hypothetical protein
MILVLAIHRSDRSLIAFCAVPVGQALLMLLVAPVPVFRYTAFLFPVAYVAAIALWSARRIGSTPPAIESGEQPV